MRLPLIIARKHLLARKRQSLASLAGIMLGVAFFMAISSLMYGSEKDVLKRLVDNSPHITMYDEYRTAKVQPAQMLYKDALVEISNVKPLNEPRGIRQYSKVIDQIRIMDEVKASPVMLGQAVVRFAGKDVGITINGMPPEEIKNVSTIENYMLRGGIDNLISDRNGIIIGEGMGKKLSIDMGDHINAVSPDGHVKTFTIVGVFRTGRANYDDGQTFADIKKVQDLLNRSNRANNIIIKLADPSAAVAVAAKLEAQTGYKTVSWQEASEDLMNTLSIRNKIMYTVVSAVLVVAAFGIYNVISTVVMEKHKDIAILKSMGFKAADIKKVFLAEGVMLGIAGSIVGVPLGAVFMYGLMQIQFRPPGSVEPINMPIDWGWVHFAMAVAFAMISAVLAAWLPARKAAVVKPVDILRGIT